jgi:hypothetical protein
MRRGSPHTDWGTRGNGIAHTPTGPAWLQRTHAKGPLRPAKAGDRPAPGA